MAEANNGKKLGWRGISAPRFLGWNAKGRSNMAKTTGQYGATTTHSSQGSTGQAVALHPTTMQASAVSYQYPLNPAQARGSKREASPMQSMYKALKQSVSPLPQLFHTPKNTDQQTSVYIDEGGTTRMFQRSGNYDPTQGTAPLPEFDPLGEVTSKVLISPVID